MNSARTTDNQRRPGQSAPCIEALEARLSDGYDRIDAAQAAGLDVVAWEAFWLDLLEQYEAACDAVAVARAA